MAQFPVKWFSSDMGGHPVLSDRTHGDLIELMKACLIYGFNPKTPASVSYEPSAGAITIVLAADHGFLKHQVVQISNAAEAEYNGEYRVIATGSDWIQLAVTTAPNATSASGSSLEIKAAPVGGWQVIAEDSATARAAFKRTAPDATDHIMVIQNNDFRGIAPSSTNNGNYAYVEIVEEFTDFDNYARTGEKFTWVGSHVYGNEEWMFVADRHMMYWNCRHGAKNHRACFVWGDIKTVRPGDVSHCICNGNNHTDRYYGYWSHGNYGGSPTSFANFGSTERRAIARAYHQLPGATSWSLQGIDGGFGVSFNYPNPQTNGFYVSTGEIMVKENGGLRGFMPGVIQPLQTYGQYHKEILDNIPGMEGIPVLLWLANASGSYNSMSQRLVGWRLDRWRPEVEG